MKWGLARVSLDGYLVVAGPLLVIGEDTLAASHPLYQIGSAVKASGDPHIMCIEEIHSLFEVWSVGRGSQMHRVHPVPTLASRKGGSNHKSLMKRIR
ncbi:unnamed protein product [Linum trigynum]|uniref:Uncharacterized protein n=1 Tax=Linum trigynum TaxID=586398 RepID=A0AAV2DAZ9_9ROSI